MSALIIGDSRHERNGEILQDQAQSGRKRPWRAHKYVSTLLSDSYQRLQLRGKAERVGECASLLRFRVCENPSCSYKVFEWGSFCRVRLCPMCSWRKSLVVAHQIRQVAHTLAQREKVRWLFLTLTVRNCEGEDLKGLISQMMEAYRRLMMYKAVQGATLGWFRSLEVTHNLDEYSNSYDTYHPHFHVLIAVKPSYFKGKNYLDQEKWTSLWQKAMKIDYKPIVHVQTVKDKTKKDEEAKILADHGIEIAPDGMLTELPVGVVAESAKYTVKSSDYIVFEDKCYCSPSRKSKRSKPKKKDYCKCGNEDKPLYEYKVDEIETDKSVLILDEALAHRRLYAYGGVLKEIWSELQALGKVEDVEDEDTDLVHVQDAPKDCQCTSCQSELTSVIYSWAVGANHYIG